MDPQHSEAETASALVARVRQGDETAEVALVERYSRGLLYFLRRRCGDPTLAEDLHQETFRIVLLRLRESGLEDPAKLSAFLHRTGLNLILADHRKSARRKTEGDEEAIHRAPDAAPNPMHRALRLEEDRLVRRLINELDTDRDRQILYRFYVAEDAKEAICNDLGLSSLHFNRVLFRARQRFRDHFLQVQASGRGPGGIAESSESSVSPIR